MRSVKVKTCDLASRSHQPLKLCKLSHEPLTLCKLSPEPLTLCKFWIFSLVLDRKLRPCGSCRIPTASFFMPVSFYAHLIPFGSSFQRAFPFASRTGLDSHRDVFGRKKRSAAARAACAGSAGFVDIARQLMAERL